MAPFLDSLKKPSQRESAPPVSYARPDRRRRRRLVLVVLLVLVVTVVGVLVTPAARRELRASFTRLPSSYTELYFTSAPSVARAHVVVPVSVVRHGGGNGTYGLRVWLVSSTGRTTASTTLTVRSQDRTSTTVRLPLAKGAQAVNVALLGHPESLHFRVPAQTSQGSP